MRNEARLSERNPSTTTPQPAPMMGCVVRLFWLVGHIALFLIAATIVRENRGALSLHSAAYWTLVALLVAARYIDLEKFDGAAMMVGGVRPPTIQRYAASLIIFAAAVWTAAVLAG